MFLPPQKPHEIFGTDIKKSRTNGILFFAVFKSCSFVFAATQVGDTHKCAVLLPKINLTAHLRKRRKTDILRRINIGSEAFKLLLSVFFSRHEAMTCRP
jgi:hypothetical protein